MAKKRNAFKTHRSHVSGKTRGYVGVSHKKPSKKEIKEWERRFKDEAEKVSRV